MPTLEISSMVHGFSVAAPLHLQHKADRHVLVLSADGSNQSYGDVLEGEMHIHLVYGHSSSEGIPTWVENDILHLGIPSDDIVERVLLEEQFTDPEYSGVVLVIYSLALGSLPYFELVCIPYTPPVTPLN